RRRPPLSLSAPRLHPALPSFPTRRSSDLFRTRIFFVSEIQQRAVVHNAHARGCDGINQRRTLQDSRRGQSFERQRQRHERSRDRDRKSTRLNSSHQIISYAVFCLKKKTHR